MQTTDVEAIERTIQKTNEWLEEIRAKMGAENRGEAYDAMSATLHALRDRLAPEEAVHLGAQLPSLIRGVYYGGWKMAGKPERIRSLEDFVGKVASEARGPRIGNEQAVRAVLEVLSNKVTAGEIADVRSSLPEPLRNLMPGGTA